jgi:valyl-tRNA synthetase
VIPYITETIWWKLNEVRPGDRTLPGRLIAAGGSPRLVKAKWPDVGDFSQAAEHIFPKLQEIVTEIRAFRTTFGIDAKDQPKIEIAAPGDAERTIRANLDLIEILGACKLQQVGQQLDLPDAKGRSSAAGCDIYFVGTVFNAEGKASGRSTTTAYAEVTNKKRDELNRRVETLRQRLSNRDYVSKAPPHLVKQTEAQLAEAEAELAKLG